MKKKILLLSMIFIFTGCSSFLGGSVAGRYNRLDRSMTRLMEDEIDENQREKLENEFRAFYREMITYKIEHPDENTAYMDEYIHSVGIKLEYLKDLKD